MDNSILLGEKIFNSQFTQEKVKCPICSEGYYVPSNESCEVNYYFHCEKCGTRVVFEKNIVVE